MEEGWRLDLTDQLLAFLVEAFPDTPIDQLQQAASCSLDYQEAVDFLLAMDAAPEEENPQETLLKIFSPYYDRHQLERRIQAACDDLERLGDDLMIEIGKRQGKPRWRRVEVSPVPSRMISSIDDAKTIQFRFEDLFGLTLDDLQGLDVDDIRAELDKTLAKRNEMYSRAASAYRRHNITGSGQAAYLSEEGRKENERAQVLRNQLAALSLIQWNPTIGLASCCTLDLHFQTVDSALLILDAFLPAHPHQELQIITGAGRHSEGGARLRPAIWQRLQQGDRAFTFDGHASFTIYPQKTNDKRG